MIALTVFRNLYDNQTDKRMNLESWEAFVKMLYSLSGLSLPSKDKASLISPAIYKEGTTRKNDNVTAWAGWCAIDVDNHTFDTENLEQELFDRYGQYRYVCYSTASSRKEYAKFRMIFPLTCHVYRDSIKHFWFALNTELDSLCDRQTKDLSRMFYIPAFYDNAFNFIFQNEKGSPINPIQLMEKHNNFVRESMTGKSFFERLPDDMKRKFIDYKRSKLDQVYNWNSYRDCPFVNKKLIDEFAAIAHIDGTGRYHTVYRIMTSIAVNAIRKGYPISAREIAGLIRELDGETTRKYEKRPLEVEADRAIEFAYRNA